MKRTRKTMKIHFIYFCHQIQKGCVIIISNNSDITFSHFVFYEYKQLDQEYFHGGSNNKASLKIPLYLFSHFLNFKLSKSFDGKYCLFAGKDFDFDYL